DVVGVAVGEQPGEGSPAGHPEPPRIVDDDQVDPPGLFALGGQAGARATADDRLAALDLLPQPLQQRSPVLHAHLRFPQQISWNAATAAAANSGSLMLCGTRWRRRLSVCRTCSSRVWKSTSSASGSWKGWPGASSRDTPPSGSRKRTGPGQELSLAAMSSAIRRHSSGVVRISVTWGLCS